MSGCVIPIKRLKRPWVKKLKIAQINVHRMFPCSREQKAKIANAH